jgi:hypothetical protein
MCDARVYLVMAETGEHEEKCYWPVKAFSNWDAAQARISKSEAWLHEHKVLEMDHLAGAEFLKSTPNPYDPGMLLAFDGITYSIQEVMYE